MVLAFEVPIYTTIYILHFYLSLLLCKDAVGQLHRILLISHAVGLASSRTIRLLTAKQRQEVECTLTNHCHPNHCHPACGKGIPSVFTVYHIVPPVKAL